MTKSRGIGRGGYRPGGGRPKGRKDSKPRKLRTILELVMPRLTGGEDELPLYALLRRTQDETLDAKYRDMLRIAVLPYLHPRAFSRLTAKPFYMMTDEEVAETRQAQLEHEKQVARGHGHLHLVKGPK
jgi:hypothetical protein